MGSICADDRPTSPRALCSLSSVDVHRAVQEARPVPALIPTPAHDSWSWTDATSFKPQSHRSPARSYTTSVTRSLLVQDAPSAA